MTNIWRIISCKTFLSSSYLDRSVPSMFLPINLPKKNPSINWFWVGRISQAGVLLFLSRYFLCSTCNLPRSIRFQIILKYLWQQNCNISFEKKLYFYFSKYSNFFCNSCKLPRSIWIQMIIITYNICIFSSNFFNKTLIFLLFIFLLQKVCIIFFFWYDFHIFFEGA